MPHEDDAEEPWSQYRRLIIAELERLNGSIIVLGTKIDNLDGRRANDISKLEVAVGMLQVKAAMLGGGVGIVGGAVASALVSLIMDMK